jgi:hypothetical protein
MKLFKSLAIAACALAAACGGTDGPTAAPVVSSFTATPSSIYVGQSAVLSWAVTGADTITIDNGVTITGSATSTTVTPAATTTYTLTAKNAAGSTPATAKVTVVKWDTAAAITTWLEGKTLVMTGADIPSHPNGYTEKMNLAASTQCYNKTTIAVASNNFNVTSLLGTLNGAPNKFDVGTCDRATVFGSPLTFTSTAVLVENVQGNATCFDVTATYAAFKQEGRASISADGKTVIMELYFGGQATGHRCADGAVGAATVKLNGAAFAGNAQQTYRVQ